MTLRIAAVSVVALALAGCGNGADQPNNMAMPVDNMAMDNMSETLPANEAMPGMTATSGQDYVTRAGASDLYEIEAAQLAIDKAEGDEIKELARMIQTDHRRSTEQLTEAAREADPPLTAAPELNAEQQANIEALRGMSGAAFDAEYLRQQVAAHEQALALVEGYAQSGDVPGLREHASTVAGPIRQHLERARALSSGGGE